MSVTYNTPEFETEIHIDPFGFREYDARWLYPDDINLRGVQLLGQALGTLLRREKITPEIVTGHDYRSYSMTIKQALIIGLMSAGIKVHDIGLCTTPAAYFAQFELDCPAVAMVTASHNENGWTGVKMGAHRPLTFGPELMTKLKEICIKGDTETYTGGSYEYHANLSRHYVADLAQGVSLDRPIKAVVACGNGTAGLYAGEALRRIGCEVIEQDCELDFTFPNVNPNPEDMAMLHRLRDAVLEQNADIGFAFDGDGDRCGVVDETGEEIFADKMGVLLARHLSKHHPKAQFVVDVKSTELYRTDPELKENGAKTDYWITGHSYIKRRVKDIAALAGFEKSGHFFFNAPIGRGYDDGILSAITICQMLDEAGNKTLSELKDSLSKTWSSPTMSPYCADDKKYDVVREITQHYRKLYMAQEKIMGRKIREIIDVNGVRVVLEDGTWGLIRASSNKPCLVVVVESPTSQQDMHDMFAELDGTLRQYEGVGEYDQKMEIAV